MGDGFRQLTKIVWQQIQWKKGSLTKKMMRFGTLRVLGEIILGTNIGIAIKILPRFPS